MELSNKTPKVSIVMCSYNEDTLLTQAIESVLTQTYQNFELIICDDKSTNSKTLEILNKYSTHPKCKIIINKSNLGYLKNKNYAISLAKGEFITQIDNDDLYDKNKIQYQIDALAQNPSIKIISCGYYRIDNVGNITSESISSRDYLIENPITNYPFWFPSTLFHKELLSTIGEFNLYFEGTMGDDYYWTILANKKYPIYHIGKPLYYYRFNPNSITNILNNDRKIIVPFVLKELINQQLTTGTDWLENHNQNMISQFESNLRQDNKFMAEQYRIWAAKAIDKGDFRFALKSIRKSILLYPFNMTTIKTLLYFIRKRIHN